MQGQVALAMKESEARRTGYTELDSIVSSEPPPPEVRDSRKQPKTVLKLLLVGAVLAILIAVGFIWAGRGVLKVETGRVDRKTLRAIVTASGEIKPPSTKFASVNANTFGKVTDIFVQEGDTVKKGQILLRTESVQQQADVEAQQAALETAQADAEGTAAAARSAAASLRSAQADLKTAQARLTQAKQDFTRGQQLMKDNLIARQVFDQRLSDYQVAESSLAAAEARVAQAKAQHQQAIYNRDMAKARVAQNRAQLVRYQDLRSKTIYTAPFKGIITSLPVNVGENVVPGIQNQPGSLLFQVADLSVITAEVRVDETDILNVRTGQPAEVSIDALPNKVFRGKVTETGMSAISSNSQSLGSQMTGDEAKDFKVVVTLTHPPPGLRPGLSATARIITATRQNTITVPIRALTVRMRGELEKGSKPTTNIGVISNPFDTSESDLSKQEIQGVFVVRNGRAHFVPVKTGIMGVNDVEILRGLQPGEEIVTGSYKILRTLRDGSRVKVDNSQSQTLTPAD